MDTGEKILVKRYALAYMRLKDTETAVSDSGAINKLAQKLEPYFKQLSSPAISGDLKIELLSKILPERNRDWNFICLLVSHGRFGLLKKIAKQCYVIADESNGVIKVEVTSSYPLGENNLNRIKNLLSANPDKVCVKEIIDKSVIGGFEIKTGDIVLDATLRGRLKRLREQLLA